MPEQPCNNSSVEQNWMGIRQAIQKWPLAPQFYLACKGLAHAVFPPYSGSIPTNSDSFVDVPSGDSLAADPDLASQIEQPYDPEGSFDIYRQYPPHVLYTFRDKDAVFRDALKAYSSVSVEDEPSGLGTDPNRVLNFFQSLEAANRLPPGDYIELGSHRGFSLRVIHKFMDPTRKLFALDTFEGFDPRDISIENNKYESQWSEGSFAPTSVERVAHYVGDGSWPSNLKVVQGWFPGSFSGLEDYRWRFVHIDFDLYQPIKTALELLWEPLLPGGIVMIHDYGCYGFPGARLAVDEFCEQIGLLPIELADRWSTAVLRKPLSRTKE